MRVSDKIRKRYMRDETPVRLGGIAANLARIHSFSQNTQNRDVVEPILNESRYFIEWATPYVEKLEQQVVLIDLQRMLTHWQHTWKNLWENEQERAAMIADANQWSNQVLEMSGLLQE